MYPISGAVFKSLSIMGRCPLNMNVLAPKIGALYGSPTKKIALKTAVKISIKFQSFIDIIVLNETAHVASRGK
jgi:hypothetical protein